jgi:hypothetical protein
VAENSLYGYNNEYTGSLSHIIDIYSIQPQRVVAGPYWKGKTNLQACYGVEDDVLQMSYEVCYNA